MKTVAIPVLAAILVVSSAVEVASQRRVGAVHGRRGVAAGRWYRAGGYGGYPYGGFGGGAVSAVGDARRGFSEVVRAQGEAAETASRARINNEQARSSYLDNRLKYIQIKQERERLGKAVRADYYAKKRESVQRYLASKRSKQPPRLSPGQLDPATGKLTWPNTLLADEYSKYRKQLDEVFELKSYTNATSDIATKITSLTKQMKNELKKHIRKMPPTEYISARRFLDKLANEAIPV